MAKVTNEQLAYAIAEAYNNGWDNYETAKRLGITYQGFMSRLKLFRNNGVVMPDLKLSKKQDVQKINDIIWNNMNHVTQPSKIGENSEPSN